MRWATERLAPPLRHPLDGRSNARHAPEGGIEAADGEGVGAVCVVVADEELVGAGISRCREQRRRFDSSTSSSE